MKSANAFDRENLSTRQQLARRRNLVVNLQPKAGRIAEFELRLNRDEAVIRHLELDSLYPTRLLSP